MLYDTQQLYTPEVWTFTFAFNNTYLNFHMTNINQVSLLYLFRIQIVHSGYIKHIRRKKTQNHDKRVSMYGQ